MAGGTNGGTGGGTGGWAEGRAEGRIEGWAEDPSDTKRAIYVFRFCILIFSERCANK